MKISILTLGTRGDVQPYLALARYLTARGHELTLAAPSNFADWIRSYGLRFVDLGLDMQELLQAPETRAALAGSWWKLGSVWREFVAPAVDRMLQAIWEAGEGADVILHHPKVFGAPDVAERCGARLVCATLQPMFPTRDFPVLLTTRSFGGWLNRSSYAMFRISRFVYRRYLQRWRKETLGLPPGPLFTSIGDFPGLDGQRWCAVSPSVVPQPSDWDARTRMVGYWFLDDPDDWQPDADLQAFLDAGPPPIYIGFGSMTTRDPQGVRQTLQQAVERAGVRAVLASGWDGGTEASDNPDCFVLQSAPHHLLFPRMGAVVHHGGAGTTAAGLRAGCPTLVCPLAVDQPFWGARVHDLGCGPRPQSLRSLRAEPLGEALRALLAHKPYRIRSAEIGRAIASEDGLQTAAALLERDAD